MSKWIPRLFLLVCLLVPISVGAEGLAGAKPPSVETLPPGIPGDSFLVTGGLEEAVAAFHRGDLHRARQHLQKLLGRRKLTVSERARGHFLLGWVSARLGHHQQASANFFRVRKLGVHPLVEQASFFEARADLQRGHGRTAIAECAAYREAWPEGTYAEECLLVQADAHISLGKFGAAAGRYESFVAANPDDRRREPIRVWIAQALEKAGRHPEAAARYRTLYLNHSLPTTARLATQGLERMREAGFVTEDFTDEQLFRRAISLRSAAQFDESWALYSELDERNPGKGKDASALGRRIDGARHDFLWKNRKYAQVGQGNAWLYDRAPEHSDAPNRLHWAVEGLSRGGKYKKASKYQDKGLEHFPNHHRFRNTWERSLKVYEGAGRYDKAQEILEEWRRRSSSARSDSRKRFLLPYYAYRAGRYSEAIAGFTPIVEGRSSQRIAALYYRGKAKYAQRNRQGGRADHRRVLKEAPASWYSVVLRSRYRRRVKDPEKLALGRDGRWPGKSEAVSPLPYPVSTSTPAEMVVRSWDQPRPGTRAPLPPTPDAARDADGRSEERVFDGWSSAGLMSLGRTADPAPVATTTPGPIVSSGAAPGEPLPQESSDSRGFDPLTIPPTWEVSSRWSPSAARALWWTFSQENQELWPELPVAYELSQAGLAELAGPILARVYAEVRALRKDKRKHAAVARWRASGGEGESEQVERWAKILDLKMSATSWRLVFGAAGYPASVAAFALEDVGVNAYSRLEPEGRAVWTLRYPAAFAPHVWRSGWEYDVDPLLMLAVMRVESRYRHDAVSHAGALGLVQVMPATGHRVAALMGDPDFRVDRLLEPEVNIRLGTFYMARLMDRFGEGQFALAVGSYNGGPHNVGRWLHEKTRIPLEEFVEEIQFRETRRYVRRVIEYYSIYCELYGDGAWVLLPERTAKDDPSVINF